MFALGAPEIMILVALLVIVGVVVVVAVLASRRRRTATPPQVDQAGRQAQVGDGFTEPTGYVAHQPTPPEQQRRA